MRESVTHDTPDTSREGRMVRHEVQHEGANLPPSRPARVSTVQSFTTSDEKEYRSGCWLIHGRYLVLGKATRTSGN